MAQESRLPYVAFAVSSTIWGSTFLAIRYSNATLPPFFAAGIRLVLAALLLAGIALVTRQRFPRGAFLVAAVLYGFFEFGVNFALLYWGERTTPSGIAAVLYATIPLSTLFFAWIFGIEATTRRKVLAALAAIAGVGVIFAGELGAAVPLLGLLSVFGAATAAALANILLRRAPQQSAIPLNAVATAVGAPFCLAASVLAREPHALPTTWAGWWPLLYLVVAGSLIAFVVFSYLAQVWAPSRASMVAVVVPVLAVAFGAVAAGERPAPLALVGGVVVLSAVIFALRSSPPVLKSDSQVASPGRGTAPR
ncbi:MAG: DMT family transporter [Thermoplasmatota archaeon]